MLGGLSVADENRRSFLKFLGAGIVGLAVGVAGGYALAPERVREIIRTATITQQGGAPSTVTITRTETLVTRLPRDTIKIGVLGIRSGTWATYGTYIEQGARLAVEEINSAGGILGSKIEISIRDEAADAVKQARELVEQERVDFLIGVDSSGNAMRIGPIMPELNRVLIIVHAATHRVTEELVYRQGIKHIFRVSVPVYQDGILAAWIAKDLPIRKWAGINPDYEYGRVSWEFFKTTLKALRPDVEFVSEQWNPSPGTTDFSKWISAVMATDAEGLFTVNWAVEAITLHKQATELGLYKKLKAVFNPMGYSMDVAYGLGKDYPRLEYGTWVSGRYVWFYPPTEINKRFVDAFTRRWGRLPAYSAETTYTAIYMIKTAIEKAGTLDLDTLIKTMENMVVISPAGVRWIRPQDHQAVYEVPYGRISGNTINVGGEAPLLTDIRAVPAFLYYRSPPDYKIPFIS
jgi:branched-chain amino acid transport system substrate-binding protein